MLKALRIYIAGPYTSLDEKGHELNTHRAIDAGIAVFKKGHYPYIPHLTHYVDLRAKAAGIELSWSDYIEWDLPWLDICDALLYLGKSKGADLELERAKKQKKRIYMSIAEIPEANCLQIVRRKASVARR
jgi:Domain of unknown function (DUF4406)